MHVDQLLRDKPLKTAFGSTEEHWKHSKTHPVSFFRLQYIFCGIFRENWCLNFDLILTPYKLFYHACMVTCVTYALVTCGTPCTNTFSHYVPLEKRKASNLVPRVSLLPAPARERERPWVKLVTWQHTTNFSPVGVHSFNYFTRKSRSEIFKRVRFEASEMREIWRSFMPSAKIVY